MNWETFLALPIDVRQAMMLELRDFQEEIRGGGNSRQAKQLGLV